MRAAEKGHADVVGALLGAGAEIDIKSNVSHPVGMQRLRGGSGVCVCVGGCGWGGVWGVCGSEIPAQRGGCLAPETARDTGDPTSRGEFFFEFFFASGLGMLDGAD